MACASPQRAMVVGPWRWAWQEQHLCERLATATAARSAVLLHATAVGQGHVVPGLGCCLLRPCVAPRGACCVPWEGPWRLVGGRSGDGVSAQAGAGQGCSPRLPPCAGPSLRWAQSSLQGPILALRAWTDPLDPQRCRPGRGRGATRSPPGSLPGCRWPLSSAVRPLPPAAALMGQAAPRHVMGCLGEEQLRPPCSWGPGPGGVSPARCSQQRLRAGWCGAHARAAGSRSARAGAG